MTRKGVPVPPVPKGSTSTIRWQQQCKQKDSRRRRDAGTAWERGKKAERNNAKAAARKLMQSRKRAIQIALRKEEERKRKGKQRGGELLHTGDRIHQQLVGGWGRCGGDHGCRVRR